MVVKFRGQTLENDKVLGNYNVPSDGVNVLFEVEHNPNPMQPGMQPGVQGMQPGMPGMQPGMPGMQPGQGM